MVFQLLFPLQNRFVVSYAKNKPDALEKAELQIKKVEDFFRNSLVRPEIMLVGTYGDKPKDTHKIGKYLLLLLSQIFFKNSSIDLTLWNSFYFSLFMFS